MLSEWQDTRLRERYEAAKYEPPRKPHVVADQMQKQQ